MKRLLVNLVNAFMIVLCGTAIVFWARSMITSEGASALQGYTRYSVTSHEGSVIFARNALTFDTSDAEALWRRWSDPDNSIDRSRWRFATATDVSNVTPPRFGALGFGYDRSEGAFSRWPFNAGATWHRTLIQVPYFALVAITGAFPILILSRRSRLQRERLAQGQCLRCGFEMGDTYHLCPVCGQRAPLPT